MVRPVLLLFAIILAGCSSSNIAVQDTPIPRGKTIGLGYFNMQLEKKKKHNTDTVCYCIGKTIQTALIPYLQKAHFKVIDLPIPEKATDFQAAMIADSMHVDYLLTATGLVDLVGKSSFVDALSLKAVDLKSGEVAFSGAFSGVAIRPVKAAGKIGQAIVAKIQ
ncbi:hypothetical protein [Filimonas effusa]|uniref:Uncharacterized protein n=1 Tax=Filimonas effusa TaxID=2508721 RepID=A0A4Q1D0N1_9BACT|nr:hypothetical protein [Filimonas effusa]RXK81304.1 hypothetical protein ESB13_20420 [Filimonas effusa]